MKNIIVALVAGALFGAGLTVSTMVRPEVVLGFLRFNDMGLLLVLGGAASVTLLAYQLAPRMLSRPLMGGAFGAHAAALDQPTLIGAAIFGIGWGISGVCPGPAIAGLGTGDFSLLIAFGGMLIGAYLQGVFAAK
jgi:uncharacterized protein